MGKFDGPRQVRRVDGSYERGSDTGSVSPVNYTGVQMPRDHLGGMQNTMVGSLKGIHTASLSSTCSTTGHGLGVAYLLVRLAPYLLVIDARALSSRGEFYVLLTPNSWCRLDG